MSSDQKELLVAYLSQKILNSNNPIMANEEEFGHKVRLQECIYHVLGAYKSEKEAELIENNFVHASAGPHDSSIKLIVGANKFDMDQFEDLDEEVRTVGDISFKKCSFYTHEELSDDSRSEDTPWAVVLDGERIDLEYYPRTDLECLICDSVHKYVCSVSRRLPEFELM